MTRVIMAVCTLSLLCSPRKIPLLYSPRKFLRGRIRITPSRRSLRPHRLRSAIACGASPSLPPLRASHLHLWEMEMGFDQPAFEHETQRIPAAPLLIALGNLVLSPKRLDLCLRCSERELSLGQLGQSCLLLLGQLCCPFQYLFERFRLRMRGRRRRRGLQV